MKKLLDWLTTCDEHGDSQITFIVFVASVVGCGLWLAFISKLPPLT